MSATTEAPASAWRRAAVVLSPAVGRTRLEWLTDSVLFAVAVLLWIQVAVPATNPQLPDWWRTWDLVLGAIATASIWWTRRYPLAVGILMLVPGALAIAAGAGALVSVYRMGLLAPIRAALAVTAAHILTALPYHLFLPLPGMPWQVWVVLIPLLYALCVCIGLLGRARRQLIVGLRATAARDRERYEERLATIRHDERQRIAREMHDVLAHRISLLSMHAGALEYRATSPTSPTPAELQDAARVIRENAQSAVEDLRELLGLLRSDDELATGAPQPRLTDLPHLIDAAVAAGQRVDFVNETRGGRLRDSTQRTVYRVVQEALTNARKHAPRALVTVRLTQDRSHVTVLASNPVPPGVTIHDLPRDGNGLVGLQERVRIDGGWFETTIQGGEFLLRAELPVGAR
ncbi:sensor histidine kinase [Microbacterium sp. CPCC 204701]|uniref:sensor histidine kinase n=1 Tax=Microbacterium sp. CPCC 204701 TaxID=2493084 RepID=UPI000FD6FD68|nr:histidine kinase [Microbacterium sp. CPCC 204701]